MDDNQITVLMVSTEFGHRFLSEGVVLERCRRLQNLPESVGSNLVQGFCITESVS